MLIQFFIWLFSLFSLVYRAESNLKTDDEADNPDMIRVIELGPFGSRIDRGLIEDLDEIPEGYVAIAVDDENYPSSVYIEPHSKQYL